MDLARQAKVPGLVGSVLAELLEVSADFDRIITTAYASGAIPDPFVIALSSTADARFGAAWSQIVSNYARQGFGSEKLATLLLAWTDERTAWDLADHLGPETVRNYWMRRMPFPVKGTHDDLERAAREYLRIEQSLAAIQSLSDVSDRLSAETVLAILDAAPKEISGLGTELGNLRYDIETIFDKLATRPDVAPAIWADVNSHTYRCCSTVAVVSHSTA